jgi:hypothetical protein
MAVPQSYHQLSMEFEHLEDRARLNEIASMRKKVIHIMNLYDCDVEEDDDFSQVDVSAFEIDDIVEIMMLLESIEELKSYMK